MKTNILFVVDVLNCLTKVLHQNPMMVRFQVLLKSYQKWQNISRLYPTGLFEYVILKKINLNHKIWFFHRHGKRNLEKKGPKLTNFENMRNYFSPPTP